MEKLQPSWKIKNIVKIVVSNNCLQETKLQKHHYFTNKCYVTIINSLDRLDESLPFLLQCSHFVVCLIIKESNSFKRVNTS